MSISVYATPPAPASRERGSRRAPSSAVAMPSYPLEWSATRQVHSKHAGTILEKQERESDEMVSVGLTCAAAAIGAAAASVCYCDALRMCCGERNAHMVAVLQRICSTAKQLSARRWRLSPRAPRFATHAAPELPDGRAGGGRARRLRLRRRPRRLQHPVPRRHPRRAGPPGPLARRRSLQQAGGGALGSPRTHAQRRQRQWSGGGGGVL
jgi:hypothetical protein